MCVRVCVCVYGVNDMCVYFGVCVSVYRYERVKSLLIPMKGRCVHALNQQYNIQPYGQGHQVCECVCVCE